MDVALVSCLEFSEDDVDAFALLDSLTARGLDGSVLAWDDPSVDWSVPRVSILRSCWNYHEDRTAFLAWAEAAARVTMLVNPLETIRWNTHKSYLIELAEAGLPVTPTVLVARGDDRTLAAIRASEGFGEVVVKPAVSASSFGTLRVSSDDAQIGEAHLRRLTAVRDVLVQPYVKAVEGRGERSLVWIDGEVTHAVRKSPRFAGEEGSISDVAVEITEAELDLAHAAVDAAPERVLYARIDMADDDSGWPQLMELELVEPSLFFGRCPAAVDRFTAAIEKRLDSA